jgi:hypothetical protein
MEDKCIETIKYLCKKYEGNSYMLQRIDTHINTYLEPTLQNEEQNHEKRIVRTNTLTQEQQIFIQVFLSKNNYFYQAHNTCFYEYEHNHYNVVKEDDILHKLLTTISQDRVLQDWKYKTKNNILKQIKERNLLQSVPNSATIQAVLKALYPAWFPSKDHAKHFLTMLGDNILKKNQDLIYFVYGKAKQLVTLIDTSAYITIGCANVTRNFIKYHESHQYANSRLLHMNETNESKLEENIGLDLLCVATHYSTRYENADGYLRTKAGDTLKKYVLFLKNNTQESIIDAFCAEMLDTPSDKKRVEGDKIYQIKWKHIHYLWKMHQSNLFLPNMMYLNTLKQILSTKFEYHEETDSFLNVTSKHLPLIRNFIEFWEQNMAVDLGNDLEIDEICVLFKSTNSHLPENDVLKILKHFFPNVELMDDKYALNVSCVKWDKKGDIQSALVAMKDEYRTKNEGLLISFDDAYTFYCALFTGKMIVNKNYFEKYVCQHMSDFIVFDAFIASEWYYAVDL